MNSSILRHVPADRVDTFKNQYENNKLLFRVLRTAMESKVDYSLVTQDAYSIHEYPNLSNVIADQAGYRRALREVMSLLPKEEK